MSDIKAIEEAVKALPPDDLAAFRLWFANFDALAWDRQIKRDDDRGALRGLVAEAEADYRAGPAREL